MFIKPYRSHVPQMNGMRPNDWLQRDLDIFIGVENRGLFYQILSRQTYTRSIVVGLKQSADCISDIEYIEICYDNKPNTIPFLMPIEKKNPIRIKRSGVKLKLSEFKNTVVERTGVKIRLYLEQTPASYLVKKESVNCIEDINMSYFDTIKKGQTSDYLLESTEHHLNAYH